MTKTYSRWHPRPIVRIGGQNAADCADPDSTDPVVIDDVAINWGRDSYLDMPRAATMGVRLLDRAGHWIDPAHRHRVGTRIELLADDGTKQWHVFRGRIATVEIEAARTDQRTGAPTHWTVHITAADMTAQLGNIIFPAGTVWPPETAIARANRLRAAGADTDITAVYFRPDAVNWAMASLDVSDKSVLDLLDDFYRSLGTTWAYNPVDNTIRDQWRLSSGGMRTILTARPNEPHRLNAGSTTYTGATGPNDPATIHYQGLGLEGCQMRTETDTVDLAPTLDINRLECEWRDFGSGNQGNEVLSYYDLPDRESWDAVRVFHWESWLSDGLQIDPVVSEWAWRILWEGNMPRHPDVTLDARERFFWSDDAYGLLRAGETPTAIYIAGSKFAQVCQHGSLADRHIPPPTFSPIGGTIRYVGGWLVTLRLQTWWTANPAAGTVAWRDLQTAATAWGDPTIHNAPGQWMPRRFSPSVTWLDMSAATDVEVY